MNRCVTGGCPSVLCRCCCLFDFKTHASASLPGINGTHCTNRNKNIFSAAIESGLELNEIVTNHEPVGGKTADIQGDLSITHVCNWHTCHVVNLHHDVRRVTIVCAPLMQCTDQIWLGRGFRHDETC